MKRLRTLNRGFNDEASEVPMRQAPQVGEAPLSPARDATVERVRNLALVSGEPNTLGASFGNRIMLDHGLSEGTLDHAAVRAHELAHVRQFQLGGGGRTGSVGDADALEFDADATAVESLVTGREATPHRSARGMALRACSGEDTAGNVGRGAMTFGGGALATGLAVLVIASGPIGWFTALSAGMLLSAGIAGMGVGTAHMATAGTRSREQDLRLSQASGDALSLASGPGSLLGGTAGAIMADDPQEGLRTGAMVGGLTEAGGSLLYGGGMAVVRVRRFNAAVDDLAITDFRWGRAGTQTAELREALRRAHGVERSTIPNPAFRGGNEVLEMSHMISNRRIAAIAEGLRRSGHAELALQVERMGVSPLNIRPMMSLEHALVDDMRFQFMARQYKGLYDNPYSPWVSPFRSTPGFNALNHPWSPVATARSLPLWLSGSSVRFVGPVRWARLATDPVRAGGFGVGRAGIVMATPGQSVQAPAILPIDAGVLAEPIALSSSPGGSGAGGDVGPALPAASALPAVGDPVLFVVEDLTLGEDEYLLCVPVGDLPEQGAAIQVE